MIYGYCRISTKKQDIERQVRNIKNKYPDAVIVKEAFTGTKMDRPEFNKIIKKVTNGDVIIFDSVSRMSRNAQEGMELYESLFNNGIKLEFLKEPHINTETYKSALDHQIELVGDDLDLILEGVNRYLLKLAKKQIEIAFEQAQKEVDDLRRRTSEGIETARLNGKQIGQRKGAKLRIRKKPLAKNKIIELSKDFNGKNKDVEIIKILGLSKNTYYKYKDEIKKDREIKKWKNEPKWWKKSSECDIPGTFFGIFKN